jgi:hypothetical protein
MIVVWRKIQLLSGIDYTNQMTPLYPIMNDF